MKNSGGHCLLGGGLHLRDRCVVSMLSHDFEAGEIFPDTATDGSPVTWTVLVRISEASKKKSRGLILRNII